MGEAKINPNISLIFGLVPVRKIEFLIQAE